MKKLLIGLLSLSCLTVYADSYVFSIEGENAKELYISLKNVKEWKQQKYKNETKSFKASDSIRCEKWVIKTKIHAEAYSSIENYKCRINVEVDGDADAKVILK